MNLNSLHYQYYRYYGAYYDTCCVAHATNYAALLGTCYGVIMK